MGDFNLCDINWEVNEGVSNISKQFIECFDDCFLNQVVNIPTRGNKILDLVLVNDLNIVEDLEVGEALGNSDHNIIRLKICSNKEIINNNRLIPDMKNGDFIEFRNLLNTINWKKEFKDKNAHEMWSNFIHIIQKFQDRCVPRKPIRNTKTRKPLWWKSSINKALKIKKRAFKKYKSTGNEKDLLNYRLARNDLKMVIRKNKKLSEIDLARNSKKDSKKFFSYYKYNSKK